MQFTITIPDERPMSWNKMYAGMHHSKRKAEADRVHMLVRAYIPEDAPFFLKPVDITVTAYFDKRPLDSSNICAKLYEDGLVGHVIEDDSPKYVASMKTVSKRDKKFPRLEILIEEAA